MTATEFSETCRRQTRHLRYARLVGAWVDGELAEPTRSALAEHVTTCWACSGYAETVRLVKLSLRGLAERKARSDENEGRG